MNIIEFLKLDKRKILLSCKVSVGNTILKDLNINKGLDVLDVKVLKVTDIAKELIYAYDLYNGGAARNIVDKAASYRYMERTLKNEDLASFPSRLISDTTVSEISRCADELRLNNVSDSYINSSDAKIIDLKKIISSYEQALLNDNSLDNAMLIIEAIKIVSNNSDILSILLPWLNKTYIGNLESNIFSELEIEFIKEISKENYYDIEFLNADITNNGAVTYSFYKAYGMVNEINHVVNEIKSKQTVGKAVLYYSVPAYVNFIKAEMDASNISYKITSGNPATETDLVQFMISLLNAAANNFLFKDLRAAVINRLVTFYNVSEDKVRLNPIAGYNEALSHGIGWGYKRYLQYIDITRKECDRLEADPDTKDYILRDIPVRREFASFLERYIDIFYSNDNNGITQRSLCEIFERLDSFTSLYTFSVNRDKIKLKDAFINLSKQLRIVDDSAFSLNDKVEYILNMLEDISIEDDADSNALLVSPITGFMAIDRPDVYIVGLSAKSFSLDTKQSPVLLDDEKREYIKIAGTDNPLINIDLSTLRNPRRKLEVESSLKTIDHGNVCMLYSYYDTIDLRDSSPSVFFLEMLGDNTLNTAKGYVEDDFLKKNMSNKTGNLYVDAEELRDCIEQVGSEIEKEKLAKQEKKAARRKAWEESKEAEYDVEGKYTEPVYKELDEENEADVIEMEGYNEDLENSPKIEAEKKDLYMSSTGIQTLLSCPLKYFYNYVNSLKYYEDLVNTGYQWLTPSHKGNLCHRVMERYMKGAFPPASKLSESIDVNLFETIYSEEIDNIERDIPAPSIAIKNREEKQYKEAIKAYIEKVHKDWVEDSNNGLNYEVIGCELGFNDIDYTYQACDDDLFDFTFKLTGSIDRVDGYVDENDILQLRIIDYKTGSKEKKEEEIYNGIQIQHYIYGIAALSYIRKYLAQNNNMFAGKSISDINFNEIAYVFPYEKKSDGEGYDLIDVTEDVNEYFTTDASNLDGMIALPDDINETLSRIVGAIQGGNLTALAKNSESLINDIIEMRNSDMDDDDKHEYTLENFCKDNYCAYKNICRKWMGGNN